ncbi:hypothetical protein, unlikely [Trypanosoma brucei gambiense DAL972]|uniref:Uncharacterized protein n=1 Tax=Trypanosoma brucei gambiense (strain MHOM/CI/86/DAL972) TaxID=679716 RepID=C9ZST5_TRYB9|nr:hypothetical protein, unlikely [Trypanosoma brucei gambiense DAL972]CBH12470.1 hypothetical protein, unlikely [Trypanosoma brucei gambiense DAL972]|eukprot:XP_011774750.1 hypothetical protein, unlikely [Trypanosoma brucei gambiense DAL972]
MWERKKEINPCFHSSFGCFEQKLGECNNYKHCVYTGVSMKDANFTSSTSNLRHYTIQAREAETFHVVLINLVYVVPIVPSCVCGMARCQASYHAFLSLCLHLTFYSHSA